MAPGFWTQLWYGLTQEWRVFPPSLPPSLKTELNPYHVLGSEAERKNSQKMKGDEQEGVAGNRHPHPSSPGDCEEGKDVCVCVCEVWLCPSGGRI